MQNIDVRFNATSNFSRVQSEIAALRAEATALGAVFERSAYAQAPGLVDPTAWRSSTRAVHEASRTFRDAASSSGLFNTQQIRATSEAERYTKAMQKQKLTMQDMLRHRGIMKQMYADQLRYQRMTAQYWGTDTEGRAITDIAVPRNVPRDLDTMGQRMHFLGSAIGSASAQMVNLGKNTQWAGRQLMVGFTYPTALFGAAAGIMAFKVEDAFAKINKVYDVSSEALTNEALKTKELGNLRVDSMRMATEVAKQYGITVEKTLAVEQELAATGLTGQSLLDSTKEVQRISALGDIDPAQTTEMVVALQTAFRKSIKDGDDLTRTLNFMNAASNATSLSLQDIAEATPRAASGMAALGGTAEEMTILLVSMREAGVNAAEGAQALKSATARILNPTILNKASEIYKSFGANIDVAKLSDQAGGNMFKFIELLGKAQESAGDLTDKQKQSAVAALFGTYQFNRLTAALTNTADAYGGVQNQTAKAMELQSLSVEELDNMAKSSEKLMMDNPAGRLKQAWAEFQIELGEVGKVFVDVAAKVLGFGADILSAFNGLGDGQKKAILLVAAIAAIAGPLVMITGLFMNLAGQATAGIGKIMTMTGRLMGAQRLMVLEEQTATLAAQVQNKALEQQATSTANLAKEVQVLTAAYRQATAVAKQYTIATSNVMPTGRGGLTTTRPAPFQYNTPIGPQLPQTQGPLAYSYRRGTDPEIARSAALRQSQMSEAKRLQTQDQINRKAAAEARIRDKVQNSVTGTSVATAAMGASMAAMMITNDEMTNNIAKWVLIGSIVVPAVRTVSVLTARGAKSAWSMAAGYMATARASTGIMGGLKGGAKGLGAGLLGLGKGNLITAGIVAALATGYALHKRHQGLIQDQVNHQKALTNTTQDWAKALGVAVDERKKLSLATYEGAKTGKSLPEMGDQLASTESGKALIAAYKDAGSESERMTIAMGQYITLIRDTDATTIEATRAVEALFTASGEGALEASRKAKELQSTIGSLDGGLGTLWKRQISELANSGVYMQEAEAAGSQIGKILADAIADGGKVGTQAFTANARRQMQQMGVAIQQGWNTVIPSLRASTQNMLSEIGITGQNLSGFVDDLQRAVEGKMNASDFNMKYGMEIDALNDEELSMLYEELNVKASRLRAVEGKIVQELATQLGISREINNMAELRASTEYKLLTVNKGNARELYKELVARKKQQVLFTSLLTGQRNVTDAQRLEIMNQIRVAMGLKEAKSLTEGFTQESKKAAKEAGNVADNVNRIPNRKHIQITADQSVSIVRTAMSNVQSAMADSAMNSFNSGWDARMAGVQAAHERASNAMENAQQNAQAAFDARWERRREQVERTYQKRIDRINREIEAERRADQIRTQLFEREKARLTRLAEMQNQNIDFNVALNEGKLDEAAKIMNNATANTVNTQMDREQEVQAAKTERRIASLEKKNARLEKQRERQIKNLEKMEERQRRHLERMQNARTAALQRQQQAEMNTLEQTRNYEEAMLEQRLTLFKAYTARNQKDLERWMREVGLSYDDFGKDVKAKGKSWSEYFRKELSHQIRVAGMEVANDNIWTNVGRKMADKLIRGLGFNGLSDFRNFVRTGEMGGGRTPGKGNNSSGDRTKNYPGGQQDKTETRHEGGVVGSGGGSRGNIPNTYKGLHRSEKMIRAQKGEYVINKKSSQQYGPVLDAINSGNVPMATDSIGPADKKYGVGGPAPGAAGIMTALISKMFMTGVKKAFDNNYQVGLEKYRAKQAAAAANARYSGQAGTYGGRHFSASQIRHAATIASTGSGMGMSKRDLQIGIMTAITESGLVNVNYGDRDSLGLFQQRPSMGWGTPAQVTDPVYASRKFFSVLKGVGNRGSMSPWMAAQTVQRSAFSDGSNYQRWWAAAQAIFNHGLTANKGKYSASGGDGFVQGSGGKHRPVRGGSVNPRGIHYNNGLDVSVPVGTPIYAVGDGVVSGSYDLPGHEPRAPHGGLGYRSYGRVITVNHAGFSTLYAHLSKRSVGKGQRVRGGAVMGASGNTGNSTGPHLHFEAHGASPYAFLRKGGELRWDNTPAVLHKGETVLTAPLTKKFKDNVATGGGDKYDISIDLRGAYIKEDIDIEKAVKKAIDNAQNKVGRKRVVN